MKNRQYNRYHKQLLYALGLFTLIGSVYGMKRELEKTTGSISSITQEKAPRFEKWRAVWIKTSDNQLITMPEWQVDQVKVLQLLLAHQRGIKSKNNPEGTNT